MKTFALFFIVTGIRVEIAGCRAHSTQEAYLVFRSKFSYLYYISRDGNAPFTFSVVQTSDLVLPTLRNIWDSTPMDQAICNPDYLVFCDVLRNAFRVSLPYFARSYPDVWDMDYLQACNFVRKLKREDDARNRL